MDLIKSYRVGADIGGTFTDIVLLGADRSVRTLKVLSTPDDFGRAIVEGVDGFLAGARLPPEAIAEIDHGTTVATNAILEKKGARVGLLTTKGFRDVLEIRRVRVPVLYDLSWQKPEPLVPRERRLEVSERAIAADEGGTSIVLMQGEDRNRERFIYMETISGAWGGRAALDGIDTASNITGLQSNTPAEVLESEYPIELVQYGYVQDSGGAGRFRGGLGLVREYRYTAERGTLQMRADRVKFAPYGIYGGQPGGRCKNIYDPYGANLTLESKVKGRPLKSGDVVRHVMAGGGGYGWAFERDVERVLRDVLDEKVSLAAARADYGVVIDPNTMQADLAATGELRAQMRARVDVVHPPLFTQ